MEHVSLKIFDLTVDDGTIYFMQREKNTEFVLRTLRKTGWTFQNLIIWNKLTSAIPSNYRFGKKYQIIAFFTKGKKPLTFNNLRYEPPLLAMHEFERETGMYLTDIWENIRELTSGFFTGAETIRIKSNNLFTKEGDRFHKQQSPIELLTRIILSSYKVGDFVLDPFAGTGVTAIVAKQLKRNSISIDIDPVNIEVIRKRLEMMREVDDINKFYSNYIYSINLDNIWNGNNSLDKEKLENYYFKNIPKNKLINSFLMKETIKNLLITNLRVLEKIIEYDYRLKDNNKKIHRFELVIRIKPNTNIILRLIYAKTINQADFWIKRIQYENEVIKSKEKNSIYLSIISGKAFVSLIQDLENVKALQFLAPFPNWEKIFNLPNLVDQIKSLNILKSTLKQEQMTLEHF